MHGLSNKLNDPDFINLISKYDISCLCETWLAKDFKFNLAGFKCFQFQRKVRHRKAKRESGGTCILVKNNLLDGIKIIGSDTDDIVWFQLKANYFSFDCDIYVASVYICPESSTRNATMNLHIFDELQRQVESYSTRGQVILCGDFNARTGKLD